MHLERVVRLIEMGAKFTIEFNPCSDVGEIRERLIREVALRIRDGGDVAMVMLDGSTVVNFGMKLANYKKVWRCWQNGIPADPARRAASWG